MLKGYLLAALAAAFYGSNPVFAIPLYNMGMQPGMVLLFRYLLSIPMLALLLAGRSQNLLISRRQIPTVAIPGLVMAISSLALYESYRHMNPGVASTLLFMYPLLTAILMTLLFHEKFQPRTAVCLAIMFCGLYLLMRPANGQAVNLTGFVIIFVSSISYAVYLVMIKASRRLREIPALKSLLYQLLFGSLAFLPSAWLDTGRLPASWLGAACVAGMALFPTVLSLLFTMRAITMIGPTATALFGALEPVTAVALSWLFLHESVSLRELAGGGLIILSTLLVIKRNEPDSQQNT